MAGSRWLGGGRVRVPGASWWALALPSGAVLALAGAATYADPGRRWVRLSVAGQPDALPSWWSTVLYALVALACLVRARDGLRRADPARAAVLGPLAWVALAGLLTVLSADRVLGLHRLLANDERLTALPGPVASHPVETVLLAVGVPVVAVLLAATGAVGRVLLVGGGCSYLVSEVLLDQRIVQPSWNFTRVETAELAFEWAGALLLAAAATTWRRASRRRTGPAALPPGSALLDAVATMDRLRSPGGCPWDAEQTHASLAPYAIEEGHEVADAAERLDPQTGGGAADRAALRDELGDLLLQVLFHARIAAEHREDPFDVDDVADALVAKLQRRHPHVFGGGRARDAAAVEAGWEELKAAERGRASAFDGVPASLPALQRADEVLGRVDRLGHTLPEAPPPGAPPPAADLGEHLLGVVRAARARGEDAEASLRAAVRRLEERGRAAESALSRPG